jgi:hypothetical protein
MSDTVASDLPIYEIQIGTNGEYSDFATTNMAGIINADIKAAPANCQIVINFEPGEYGLKSSIVLPSNTSVIGNDATLIALPNATSNWSCIENADSGVEYSAGWGKQDSNISVTGLTFIISDQHDFGTWFVNASDIDVQNNVYIGGVDGNAFTSVINGVVANNIAFGQDNVSYDNWNGPVNVTIENNSSYIFGADEGAGPSGWNVLFNASTAQLYYSGDAIKYGVAAGSSDNDAIINNLFSSDWPTSATVNTDALLSYGFATSTNITQQGNVSSGLGFTDTGLTYSASPMNNTTIEDDEFVGLVEDKESSSDIIASLSEDTSSPLVTQNSNISGNLIFGLLNDSATRPIENEALYPVTINNADILANSISSYDINNDSFGTPSINEGNIVNSGTTTEGSGVLNYLGILAPSELFVSANNSAPVNGVSVEDESSGPITISLIAQFGTIGFLNDPTNVTSATSLGNAGFIITGDLSTINSDLAQLEYTSNKEGRDDSIELTATDSNGSSATRYIPITTISNDSMTSSVTTIVPGEVIPESGTTTIYSGFTGSNLPTPPNLSGDTVIAAAGNNLIDMSTADSVVFTGAGKDTILGGDNDGYITTGQGYVDVELAQSGDYTVAGGAGSLLVNAVGGNNVLEAGASNATFNLGAGLSSVIGGLGALTLNGGSGEVVFCSLPEDGGSSTLNLGSGNSTIFALSGSDIIETKQNTSNIIYTGLGSNMIFSGGNDIIDTGAGSVTIDATAGGNDTVNGISTGSFDFIGGSGSSFIVPSSGDTVVAGAGNLNVASTTGSYTLDLGCGNTFNDRIIALGSLPTSVDISGYQSNPVIAESDSSGIFSLTLSDGTTIAFLNSSNWSANELSDLLGFSIVPILHNQMYANVNDIPGISGTDTGANAKILNGLISSAQPNQAVLLYSSGLSNNGVIQL